MHFSVKEGKKKKTAFVSAEGLSFSVKKNKATSGATSWLATTW